MEGGGVIITLDEPLLHSDSYRAEVSVFNNSAVGLENRGEGGLWGRRLGKGFLSYASPCSYHWISSFTLVTISTSSAETSQHTHGPCVQVSMVHVSKACLPCVFSKVADEKEDSVTLGDTWSTASMISDALLTACTLQEADVFLPLGDYSPLGAHSGK